MNILNRLFALIAAAFLMCMVSGTASAQDYIHTYDSAPIKAKVLEIGDDYIYYRTWDKVVFQFVCLGRNLQFKDHPNLRFIF